MAAPANPPVFIDQAFWDQEITDRRADMAAGWVAYTPAWTASSGTPSVGNGTLVAAYKRLDTAKMMSIRIRLIAGSTTGYGTGQWSFSLPAGVSLPSFPVIHGHVFGPSSARWAATAYLSTAGGVERVAVNGTLGVAGNTPFNWASGHRLYLGGTFEIN